VVTAKISPSSIEKYKVSPYCRSAWIGEGTIKNYAIEKFND
jgi:hypothetical protein